MQSDEGEEHFCDSSVTDRPVDLHIPDQIISDAIDFLPAMRAACNLFILWMISSMESQAVHLVGLDS